MIQILATPKGTIQPHVKAQLTKKGVILIETDEPEKVRLINAEVQTPNDDFFLAALKGLAESISDIPAKTFVKELYERLKPKP